MKTNNQLAHDLLASIAKIRGTQFQEKTEAEIRKHILLALAQAKGTIVIGESHGVSKWRKLMWKIQDVFYFGWLRIWEGPVGNLDTSWIE